MKKFIQKLRKFKNNLKQLCKNNRKNSVSSQKMFETFFKFLRNFWEIWHTFKQNFKNLRKEYRQARVILEKQN